MPSSLPRPIASRRSPGGAIARLLTTAMLYFALALAGACAEPVKLRLIAFNDFHGQLEPGANVLTLPDPDDPARSERVPAGGAAWLAGLIGQLRSEAPNAMVFSSGDMIGAAPLTSTLFRHESTIAVMNLVGLDFGIVGNHEFDAGADELRRVARGGCAQNAGNAPVVSCALGGYVGAKFPLLAANVVGPDGQPIFPPTLVKQFGEAKVGFIGVVTRALPAMVMPSGIVGLKVLDESETLNRYAEELKKQGVGAIVAVVHEGGAIAGSSDGSTWNDLSCKGREGEIFNIANKLSYSIDLVFSAHTHQGYNCVVDTPQQTGLRVIQATSYGRGLSVIDMELDASTGRVDRAATRSRNIAVVNQTRGKFAAVPTDPVVAGLVGEYAGLAAPRAGRPVGSVTGAIERAPGGSGDFPAGRLIADAQLAATRAPDAGAAQIALTNAGGVRASLPCLSAPPCTVTYGEAFTMQPFGNSLVVMTLTGQQLKAAIEDQQQPDAAETRFLQPSRGLSYTWKRGAPYGQRVQSLALDGAPVQPEARYRVTVNGFLAEGGDGFKHFAEGGDRVGGPLDSEALVDFLQTHQPYSPDVEPRVKVVD